jgi:uncharacterized protein involved in exopolysaccharide biosynthesis
MTHEVAPENAFFDVYPVRPENAGGAEALKQIFFVVFKWWRLIACVFVAFTVAAATVAWMKPPIRSASAEVLIKADRVPLQLSGLGGRLEKNQLQQIINSEIELIKSRHVLGAVAMKLLANPENDGGVDEAELESKIESLSGSTFAVAVPGSNVLQVTYFAETSGEAQKTLGMIVDEYIEKQAAIQSGSDKLLKFYEQEKQRVQDQLREAENRLNEWQSKNGTILIDEQIRSQLEILEDRSKTLQQTDAQLESTKAKVAMLTHELQKQPERLLMGQEQVKNPVVTKLEEQLLMAEASLQELLQRFTENHRTVQEKKEQIAFLRKELAAAVGNVIGRETTGLNPLRENIKQQFADSQALLFSLISQKGILRKQVQEASAMLPALREKKAKIDELSRLVDLHKEAFMLYGKKLEEGRVATGLGKEQLANVALISPAHAERGTDFGKRIKIILFSAFVGLALGMGIGFALEFFSNAVRTRQDIEYYLRVPALATIPDLSSRPLPSIK